MAILERTLVSFPFFFQLVCDSHGLMSTLFWVYFVLYTENCFKTEVEVLEVVLQPCSQIDKKLSIREYCAYESAKRQYSASIPLL